MASYTDEQLLEILRDLAAELGRSPTVNKLLARRDLPASNTYCRHFGSWNAALEAAGLKTSYHRTPTYSDEQLLQTLRDLAAELGRSPTCNELLARADLPTPVTYIKRFESWNAALEAAGLEMRRYRRPTFSDEQLIQILRDLAAELGHPPGVHELLAHRDRPSSNTYSRRFGSWNAALEAAGLQTRSNRAQLYTDEQLLQILRDLAAELGRSPMQRELQAHCDRPSSRTYNRRFGSWNAALEAAGLKISHTAAN